MSFEELKMLRQKVIKLNDKQKYAYELMEHGKSVFITGSGGVGKSACIKMFYNLNKNSKIIAMTSTTGTSSILINGTTLHSYLGIGLGKGTVSSMSTAILTKKYISKKWKKLDVLIIDEISMLSPELFDKLEEIARIVRKNPNPFGGIQLILSGDFCQLPCINSLEFCFSAKSWNKCINNTCYLTEIIRQSDLLFQKCLNEVRLGNVSESTVELLQSRVGVKLLNQFGIQPTRLYPLNKDVDSINNKELNKLDTMLYQYDIEVGYCSDCSEKTKELLKNKYMKNIVAPESIILGIGCQVMLINNLDIENKLANGSRGIITHFVDNIPNVKFINGVERLIDYHTWEIEDQDELLLTFTQIPLKLAWSTSIHKCQGSTLDYVEIDLENIFEYGQAYCGLSRVKNIEGLSISSLNIEKIKAHPDAVKYYEELEN
jgi:ATP-dependent DNA helicase PIF1